MKKHLILVLLLLSACTKDDTVPVATGSNISSVMNNNFSLLLFNYAVSTAGYTDTLRQPGPYTVIAPSNDAFKAAGYLTSASVVKAGDSLRILVPYHFLKGQIRLDSLPLAFDQSFTAVDGKPLYITHWSNSRDTAVTVNGARISTMNQPGGNGLINISDGMLYPSQLANVQENISGDTALTFFNAALLRSGVASTLQQAGPFTVFAPSNAAFRAQGITGTDSIYNMDPKTLQSLVNAHIVAGRHFIYDYILKADVSTDSYTETSLGGTSMAITLVPDYSNPGRFSGISIQDATVSHTNQLADNGVVHTVSSFLIP